VLFWTPMIAPGDLIFYVGKMVPAMEGFGTGQRHREQVLIRILVTSATAKSGGTGTSAIAFLANQTARSGCSSTAVPADCFA
jgi:hypothetical protein